MTRIAWITGASSGLGEALARHMARAGWRVAVSARSAGKLAELEQSASEAGSIHAYPLDITDAAATASTLARIEAELGDIDQAVLNAGTHKPVHAASLGIADFDALARLNLMGTVNCLVPLVSRMSARRRGRIAIVASMAGYFGLPTSAAYGMTKAGLINMAESLRPELERLGVTLQLVNPGFVRTPLTDLNPFKMPFLMEPNDAAAAFLDGLRSGRFEIVFPRRLAYMLKLLRCLPYGMSLAVTRRLVPRA